MRTFLLFSVFLVFSLSFVGLFSCKKENITCDSADIFSKMIGQYEGKKFKIHNYIVVDPITNEETWEYDTIISNASWNVTFADNSEMIVNGVNLPPFNFGDTSAFGATYYGANLYLSHTSYLTYYCTSDSMDISENNYGSDGSISHRRYYGKKK